MDRSESISLSWFVSLWMNQANIYLSVHVTLARKQHHATNFIVNILFQLLVYLDE